MITVKGMDKYVQFSSADQGGRLVTRLAPEAAPPWHGAPAQPRTSALGLCELFTGFLAFLCKITLTQTVQRAVLCSPCLLASQGKASKSGAVLRGEWVLWPSIPCASVWHGSFQSPSEGTRHWELITGSGLFPPVASLQQQLLLCFWKVQLPNLGGGFWDLGPD